MSLEIESLNDLMKEQMLAEPNTSPCFCRGYMKGFAYGFQVSLSEVFRKIDICTDKQELRRLIEEWLVQSQSL